MGHQNVGVCDVSHTYVLGCLRYGEKHAKYILISCGCMLLFTKFVVFDLRCPLSTGHRFQDEQTLLK